MDVELEAPELFRTSLTYSGKGPFFRQLSGDPTFQGDGALSVYSTLELGRVAPEGWGVSVPVTFSHTDFSQDPTFLAQTDVRVDQVDRLRETGSQETRFEVGLRKTTPMGNRVLDPLLDGLNLRAGYSRTRVSTATLESEGSGVDARAEYFKEVTPRDVALIPGFAEGLVRALLPMAWEESLLESRLRWTPDRIQMGTLFTSRDRESFRYEQILTLPEDSAVTPTLSPLEALETNAQVDFRPLNAVSAEFSFFSVRDLLSPQEAIQDSSVHPALRDARGGLGPIDLGWETNRIIRTRFGFRPSLASWLSTDLTVSTDYASDRNAALVEDLIVGTDTVVILQRNANGNRTSRAQVSLNLGGLARGILGSPPEAEAAESAESDGGILGFFGAFDPIFIARQGGLSSRFFREPVDPGVGFQLGWGDRDARRFLGTDTASIFTGQTTWTGGTGVRLPLNLRLTGNYSESRTDILHARSDRELWTRSWPDVRVILGQVALPERARSVIQTLSLSSGYRKNSRESTYGGRGLQRRYNEEWQIPLEASATWAGTLTTRYNGSYAKGEGGDPTGGTRTRRHSHTFLLSSTFEDPPLLGEKLDGPLRMTVGYQYSSELDCRIPQGQSSCVPFVDFLNRSLNLTLDTLITQLEIGLHITYTSRRSFVGQRGGSTQFQLGLFGQFLFDQGAFVPPSDGSPAGFGLN
jgi:hypothetical protein